MQEIFLNAAVSIGNTLCRDAIHHDKQCNWIGADNDIVADGAKPFYAALKGTWYSGTAGIGWFLAQLFTVTGDKKHRAAAGGAIEKALETTSQIVYGKLGFHSGLTGIAFAAIEAAPLIGRPDFTDRGLQLLHQLSQLPESEYSLDVIDGCAGAIPAIIRMNRQLRDGRLDDFLCKMGDFLLREAQSEPSGISWNTLPGNSSASLTGYAHGAAGIAAALLELYHHNHNERYRKAAYAGFAYEDACFNTEQENWPDFRQGNPRYLPKDGRQMCSCAWCHGAPGIGLSRFRAQEITGDLQFGAAAQTAVNTTLRFFGPGFQHNYSLCHGMFGNADLLLYAARMTGDENIRTKIEAVAGPAAEQFLQQNIPPANGTQSDLYSPNLMLGAAGMGYGFLRLTDPEKFGSVLIVC